MDYCLNFVYNLQRYYYLTLNDFTIATNSIIDILRNRFL